MVVEMAPGVNPRPGRVPEQELLTPETCLRWRRRCGTFRGRWPIVLGFSPRGEYIGERAKAAGPRGPHTLCSRDRRGGRAERGCRPLGVLLRLLFGFLEHKYFKNNSWLIYCQFGRYFLKYFSETKNSRKQGTGTVASC